MTQVNNLFCNQDQGVCLFSTGSAGLKEME